jgi:hypothetical protein
MRMPADSLQKQGLQVLAAAGLPSPGHRFPNSTVLSLLSPLFSAVPPLLSAAGFRAKDDVFQKLGRRVREATYNPFPAPFAASLAGASPKAADFLGLSAPFAANPLH